jgi:hypothetical protein
LHQHTGEPVSVQKPRPGGAQAGWQARGRDWISEAAMANLPAWVPDLNLCRLKPKPGGYKAVATWRASNSGRPSEDRELNLHIDTMIYDYGDKRGYSPVSLVMAALRFDKSDAENWLAARVVDNSQLVPEGAFFCLSDDDGEPWPSAKLRAAKLAAVNDNGRKRQRLPAYVSIDEGQRRMRDQIESFVADAIDAEERGAMPIKVIAAEAGLGKTHATVEAVVDVCRQGLSVGYAVPELFLAEEVCSKLKAADPHLDVRVWNGFEREGMCQRAQEAKALVKCGIGIDKLCNGAKGEDGYFSAENACPFIDRCAYVAQKKSSPPQVWIFAHAALFLPPALRFPPRPGDGEETLGYPDLLIIDETFTSDSVVVGGQIVISKNFRRLPGRREIDEGGRLVKAEPYNDLALTWDAIVAALEAHSPDEVDPISMWRRFAGNCNLFIAAGLTVEAVRTLRRYLSGQLANMRKALDLSNAVRDARFLRMRQKALNKYLHVVGGVLECMEDEITDSGRIWTHTLHSGARAVRSGKVKHVQPFWHERAAVLLLDATPPPVALLAAVLLGREVAPPVEISVERSAAIRVMQVTGAPFHKSKIIKDGRPGPKFATMDKVSRDIAAAVGGKTLIVPRAPTLKFVEVLKDDDDKPTLFFIQHGKGHAYESPGKVVGRNDWEKWQGLVITASTELSLFDVESAWGVISGHMPAHNEPPAVLKGMHGRAPTEYERVLCTTRQGGVYEARRKRAMDENVAELDRHLSDRTYVQVAARLRGIWRDGKPGLIVIFADCDLPFRADVVMSWDAFQKKGTATEWRNLCVTQSINSSEDKREASLRNDAIVSHLENHVMVASAALIMLAEPGRFASAAACRKSLSRKPVNCPDGWRSVPVVVKDMPGCQFVFHDPAVVALDGLPAVLERITGRPCRVKNP